MGFDRSSDDGGVSILTYELWIDGGNTNSLFSLCTTYDFAVYGFTFTVDATANSLTSGTYYRFKYRAKNERGYSDFSNILRVGLGPLPSKPINLKRSTIGNTETSIAIDWDDLTTETLAVNYYSLFIDDG